MKRLAALFLLPLLGCRTGRLDAPRRVVLTLGTAWVDVTPMQREGIRMLIGDLATTADATALEPQGRPLPPASGEFRIELEGARLPEGLRLRAHLRMPGRPDWDLEPVASDPRAQMEEILAAAGLRSRAPRAILPEAPDRLLPLADLYARTRWGGDADAIAAGQEALALAKAEPRCAPAAYARGAGLYRALLRPGPPDVLSLAAGRQAMDVALGLLPGYPRAARLDGRFHIEVGDQRRAFDVLLAALGRWPRAPGLRSTLAYAARTTGLLEPALELARRDRDLMGSGQGDEAPIDNACLYAGQWPRFEGGLDLGSDERPDPMRDFYRGYIRLIQGRMDESLPFFRQASQASERDPQFRALSQVYLDALTGKPAEARLMARNLALSRKELRVPDGEFTFKLAEAFAFLGDIEPAMDAAQLAFSQGFGCTAWYERAPLLAPLRGLPRWRALVSHLQARQRLFETQFPPQTLGG